MFQYVATPWHSLPHQAHLLCLWAACQLVSLGLYIFHHPAASSPQWLTGFLQGVSPLHDDGLQAILEIIVIIDKPVCVFSVDSEISSGLIPRPNKPACWLQKNSHWWALMFSCCCYCYCGLGQSWDIRKLPSYLCGIGWTCFHLVRFLVRLFSSAFLSLFLPNFSDKRKES